MERINVCDERLKIRGDGVKPREIKSRFASKRNLFERCDFVMFVHCSTGEIIHT